MSDTVEHKKEVDESMETVDSVENEDCHTEDEEVEAKGESEESHSENETEEKESIDNDVLNSTAEDSLNLNASSLQSEDSMDESIEEEKESLNNSTVSNKRNRKKVERFVQEVKSKDKEEEVVDIKGDGVVLGSIVLIESMIGKTSADELKTLHKILFNRPGSHLEIKRNIRKFNGFPFTKETDLKEYEKKKKRLEKLTLTDLRKILTTLGLGKIGTKPEIVERIIEFIISPVDKGKKLPTKKKRKSKTSKPKKQEKKVKKGKTKKVETKLVIESDEDGNDSSEEESDKEEEQSIKGSDEDDISSEEEPVPVKKVTPKKVVKVANKSPAKKRKVDQDSSKGPASKKKKDNPPTDAQIKALVTKILKKADLAEVTMKKVCQQVYDCYPNHNLDDKKHFIKETVKTIIS